MTMDDASSSSGDPITVSSSCRNNTNTNGTDIASSKGAEDGDLGAVLYIIVVLTFYSFGIVIMIVKYLKTEKKEIEEEMALESFFKGIPNQRLENEREAVNRVAIQAFHTLTAAKGGHLVEDNDTQRIQPTNTNYRLSGKNREIERPSTAHQLQESNLPYRSSSMQHSLCFNPPYRRERYSIQPKYIETAFQLCVDREQQQNYTKKDLFQNCSQKDSLEMRQLNKADQNLTFYGAHEYDTCGERFVSDRDTFEKQERINSLNFPSKSLSHSVGGDATGAKAMKSVAFIDDVSCQNKMRFENEARSDLKNEVHFMVHGFSKRHEHNCNQDNSRHLKKDVDSSVPFIAIPSFSLQDECSDTSSETEFLTPSVEKTYFTLPPFSIETQVFPRTESSDVTLLNKHHTCLEHDLSVHKSLENTSMSSKNPQELLSLEKGTQVGSCHEKCSDSFAGADLAESSPTKPRTSGYAYTDVSVKQPNTGKSTGQGKSEEAIYSTPIGSVRDSLVDKDTGQRQTLAGILRYKLSNANSPSSTQTPSGGVIEDTCLVTHL